MSSSVIVTESTEVPESRPAITIAHSPRGSFSSKCSISERNVPRIHSSCTFVSCERLPPHDHRELDIGLSVSSRGDEEPHRRA